MKNNVFRNLSNHNIVDLIPYIKEYLATHDDINLYIGTDSQVRRLNTTYAIAIVLHNKGTGGHVLYSKSTVHNIKDRFTRLWGEVDMSVACAEYLKENDIQAPEFIDLDFNPDIKYKSNVVLASALGYVMSLGYVPRCKPNAIAASYVADLVANR